MPDETRIPSSRPAAPPAGTPDPEFAWMAIIIGALAVLGGAGLATLSFLDGDGRGVLWIALGTIGVVGVVFGVRALARIRTTRR